MPSWSLAYSLLDKFGCDCEFPLGIRLLNTDPQAFGSVSDSHGIGNSVLTDIIGVNVALFKDGLNGHWKLLEKVKNLFKVLIKCIM